MNFREDKKIIEKKQNRRKSKKYSMVLFGMYFLYLLKVLY